MYCIFSEPSPRALQSSVKFLATGCPCPHCLVDAKLALQARDRAEGKALVGVGMMSPINAYERGYLYF